MLKRLGAVLAAAAGLSFSSPAFSAIVTLTYSGLFYAYGPMGYVDFFGNARGDVVPFSATFVFDESPENFSNGAMLSAAMTQNGRTFDFGHGNQVKGLDVSLEGNQRTVAFTYGGPGIDGSPEYVEFILGLGSEATPGTRTEAYETDGYDPKTPWRGYSVMTIEFTPTNTLDDWQYMASGRLVADHIKVTVSGPLQSSACCETRGQVPEPSVWALLIAGFGAVGGVVRNRRGRRLPL